MMYFLAAGLVIALATAGVALYLAITTNQDAVTKSQLETVRDDIAKVRTDAQADTQAQLKAINDTLLQLQTRVAAAEAAAQQAKQASQTATTACPLGGLRSMSPLGEREVPMPEGYCVKERKKVEIKDPQQVTMKNGRPAIQGTCPDCGTKIFKIGKLEG
jgi:hypothetical protein